PGRGDLASLDVGRRLVGLLLADDRGLGVGQRLAQQRFLVRFVGRLGLDHRGAAGVGSGSGGGRGGRRGTTGVGGGQRAGCRLSRRRLRGSGRQRRLAGAGGRRG